MEQLLVVLSNPHDGRDDEFNDWYSYVHVRDVMRLSPGAIAVQRFRLSAGQFPGRPAPAHQYLAIYEADAHKGFTEGHADVFTPTMPISDSFRFDDMREAYYEPLAAKAKVTDRGGNSDVIVERITFDAEVSDFTSFYIETRFTQIMHLPGVTEGVFSRIAAEQMLKPNPDSHFLVLYRTTDPPASLQAWTALDAANPLPWPTLCGCYTPIMPRLTSEAARNPTSDEASRVHAARNQLGDRVYSSFPPELLRLLNMSAT